MIAPAQRSRFLWALPLIAALAVYAIAPWGDLVWDDQLVARQQMAALRGLADVFRPPENIPQWTYTYYRPVVVLSYLLDQALFGRGAAAGPHVANVLYHLLATAGVWMLAQRLLRDAPSGSWGALFAATLFAVHPIHAESVSWVTGRSDVLAALLLLPALLALLRWRDSGSFAALLAAPLLYLGALLAKEVALAGLVIAPLLLALAPAAAGEPGAANARSPSAAVRWLAAGAAWIAAAAFYWWLRQSAGTAGSSLLQGSGGEIVTRALRALGYYLVRLVWPWPQSNFVPWEAAPGAFAAGLICLSALVIGLFALWRRRSPGGAAGLFGLLWVALTLAPAVAVALTGVAATPLAERYLYVPSAGLVLALGAVVAHVHARGLSRPVAAACIVVLVVAGAATVARGVVWLSDLRLWSDALRRSGDHAVPLIEFGKAHFQARDLDAADAAFRRAITLADTPRLRATASYNAGAVAASRGREAEALRLFAAAVEADRGYALGHFGVGRVEYEQGLRAARAGDAARAAALFDSAMRRQDTALRLNPSYASAYLDRARILASQAELLAGRGEAAGATERYRAAIGQIEIAARLEPLTLSRPEVQQLQSQVLSALATGAAGQPP